MENIYSSKNSSKFKHTKVAVIFIAALLFAGCPMEDNEIKNSGFIPVGEWSYGLSGYNISNTTVEFYSPSWEWDGYVNPAENLKGTIEIAKDFSSKSGVLLIKITETDGMNLTLGKYTCVYYRDYTPSHVLLANPVDASFAYIETDTLNQAKKIFTVDNAGNHVSFWGSGYTK